MKVIDALIPRNFTPADRKQGDIQWIVVHYFGSLGTAADFAAYYGADENAGASAHYAVDETAVYKMVEDTDISWHTGGVTDYRLPVRNANSIGVELRPRKLDESDLNGYDSDWYFHPRTLKNAAELITALMEKWGIDKNHVVRHFDVTGKLCPRPFVGDDVNAVWGISGNEKWARWKEMSIMPEFTDIGGHWAEESILRAAAAGLLEGDGDGAFRPDDSLTRAEAAVIFDRLLTLLDN